MDLHSELRDFSGMCRLFPLPGLVLFPHVILPLHIFEPRYRQMTRDALDGDRLITMVQACPADPADPWAEPVRIPEVACVGKIIRHEALPDGRFNMLLLGCQRVRIVREVPGETLYRVAEAALIDDEEFDDTGDPRRSELVSLFLEVQQLRQAVDPELSRLIRSDLPAGILTDIIAHAVDLGPDVKQSLLEEPRVDRRVDVLIALLRERGGPRPNSRRFPHPFSLN